MIERSKTMQIMDQLEELVLKNGWPVPCTPYYLVHHEKMLHLLDQLRINLQDEVDGRFIKAFANHEAGVPDAIETQMNPKKMNQGKERSH